MNAFFGSAVEGMMNFLEWALYSSPFFLWLLAGGAVAGLVVWALSADSAYDVSNGRTFHSFGSSLPLAFLFMLYKETIRPGNNVYAFVTLAKKGTEFAAGDPSTWSFSFCLFLILLVVCTLFGFILAIHPSRRQLILYLAMLLGWPVFFRVFMLLEDVFLVGGLLNFAVDVLMFFACPVGALVSVLYMFSAPKDDLRTEQRLEDIREHNFHVLRRELPETLTLPSGVVVRKRVDDARQFVSYHRDNSPFTIYVKPSDLCRLKDGNSALKLYLHDFDEEETLIPLNKSVSDMWSLEKDK